MLGLGCDEYSARSSIMHGSVSCASGEINPPNYTRPSIVRHSFILAENRQTNKGDGPEMLKNIED